MTTFDKREEGFEAKFAHDEELRFRALARRNKMLGIWAAGLMGKKGADADTYSSALIASDFLGATNDRIVLKLVADLKAQGIERTPQDILSKMSDFMVKALADIDAGH